LVVLLFIHALRWRECVPHMAHVWACLQVIARFSVESDLEVIIRIIHARHESIKRGELLLIKII